MEDSEHMISLQHSLQKNIDEQIRHKNKIMEERASAIIKDALLNKETCGLLIKSLSDEDLKTISGSFLAEEMARIFMKSIQEVSGKTYDHD